MKSTPKIIAALIFGLTTVAVASSIDRALAGSFILGGKTLLDPPANEPKDTHLQLFLTGDAAKSLYGAMHVNAKRDECFSDGSVTKFIGGTVCTMSKSGKDFNCSLSLNIRSQRIDSAYVC